MGILQRGTWRFLVKQKGVDCMGEPRPNRTKARGRVGEASILSTGHGYRYSNKNHHAQGPGGSKLVLHPSKT